jgi:hypothetical protein
MQSKYLLFVLFMILLLAACGAPTSTATIAPQPATATPVAAAVRTVASTPAAGVTVLPAARPANTATSTSEPTPAPIIRPPTATPQPTPLQIRVEPTLTPIMGEHDVNVGDLPIGRPGHYVNVTYGYWLQYLADWYTGFGNRPLLVSFSNLDPGTHNRISMRAEGCLIEVNAAANIYGYGFDDLMSQSPRSFPNAERFDLAGAPALRTRLSSGDNPFDSEEVYVGHGERLFLLTFEYAREAAGVCRPVWENMLQQWRWFEPDLAVYRNADYGYALSFPRDWYRFNAHDRGISVSSTDPSGMTDLMAILEDGMLIQTDVVENSASLPLEEWLAAQDWEVDLADDVSLEDVRGVRIIREGPSPQIRETSAYFQGPLGKVYVVSCLYRADQIDRFQPIANAIIYSFEF